MAQNSSTFADRVRRIEASKRRAPDRARGADPHHVSVVVHADGVERATVARRGLRFGFPLRGVIFATLLTIFVKGYMMWTLGDEVYGAAVAELLAGNRLQQAAGLVLKPDLASLFVVDLFQYAYRVILSVGTAFDAVRLPSFA
jgi:hypothetical protein